MQLTDNAPEKLLEQCLLTVILVVAACARFYCLDQNALSAAELSNLLACDAPGWLAMVAQYLGNSGMPPAYPTLLCQFSSWTSHAEFFARALSAAAGIASVYMVYLFGRYFLSPISGLLAAAAVATNLQMILLDRTATLYPLLTLFMLAHSYCFCRLLVACDSTSSRNIAVNLTGERWGLQWHWRPGFSCDARFLLGFWISGALAFYTSTIALVLLITELALCFFLVESGKRRIVLQTLWIPLLVAMLPWMPLLYERRQWALHGNIFEMGGIQYFVSRLQGLLPVNAASLRNQFVILLVSALTVGVMFIRGQYSEIQKRFLLFIGIQIIAGMMTIWFIKASDPQSYFYFLCILVLVVAETAAVYIRKFPAAIFRKGLVVAIVVAVVFFQIDKIRKNKVYEKASFSGFEVAARIIRDDKSFMSDGRKVFTSQNLFGYYLRKYGITAENELRSGQAVIDAADRALGNKEFYYLEYSSLDADFRNDYPVFQQLSQKYNIRCLSKGGSFRITKFSSEALPAEYKVEQCLSYLSKGIAL